MSETSYTRPVPNPTPDDAAFWEGCRHHELLLQRCASCGSVRYWNKPMCPKCLSTESETMVSSGRGVIWSYTTTHHGFNKAWADHVPYTVIVVELDEGPRMTSTLAGEGDIGIGKPVEVVFDDVTSEVTLPRFQLIDG